MTWEGWTALYVFIGFIVTMLGDAGLRAATGKPGFGHKAFIFLMIIWPIAVGWTITARLIGRRG